VFPKNRDEKLSVFDGSPKLLRLKSIMDA